MMSSGSDRTLSTDLPEHWSPMSSNENLLMVEVKGEEYESVKASFTKDLWSDQTVSIEKIERIQNPKLYKEYQDQLELTKLKNPPTIINETECLCHVASYRMRDVNEWVSEISERGFYYDEHKSEWSHLGSGMLFGESGWSVFYSSTLDNRGHSSSFQCSVITGTCCKGRPGLTFLPKNDSAVDNIDNPTRYSIFNGKQILPKYLITYKKIKFDV